MHLRVLSAFVRGKGLQTLTCLFVERRLNRQHRERLVQPFQYLQSWPRENGMPGLAQMQRN
jgi:hypothetical protein